MDQPTWPEVMEAILDSLLERVHTAMPGKILAYDHSQQTARVEPQLRVARKTLPVIPDVPVIWPIVYGDLAVGDTVLLVFCESDIGLWRQQGQAGEPQDTGRLGLHGAVAIAGLRPAANALNHVAGTVVVPGASQVRLGDYDASEKLLRGSIWAAFMAATGTGFLDRLAAWVGAVDGVIGPLPTTPQLLTEIVNYKSGLTGTWLSTRVYIP